MAVNPLDVYRVVADPEMDPDAKRAQINMLYGVAAPPMIARAPDMRTAQMAPPPELNLNVPLPGGGVDASTVAPAPPPERPDTPLPDPGAFRPMNEDFVQPAAGATGFTLPQKYAAPAAANAEPATATAAAVPASATVAPTPSDEERLDIGIRQLFGGALRGTPARHIPAHDQPTASVEERARAIPDDIKQRMADDAASEAKLATEEGEQAGKAHLDAAIAADNEAHGSRTDQAEFIAREKAQHEHLAKLDTNFEQLVKDTEYKPGEWWASKSTGGKVLTLLSAVMFGLAGDPQGLQKVIDDDMALRDASRKTKLGAAKSQLDAFRAQMISPEAAHAAERALAAQAVAADARRLAEAAAAPEARLRGLQVAQHFQDQFDQWSATMAREETGTIRTNIAHVPERITGGAPNPLAVIGKGVKELGLKGEGVVRSLSGGSYGGEESPDEAKRRVIFSGGQVGYVGNEGQQKDTQEMVSAVSGLKSAYARILELTRHSGHTIAGKERAQLETNVANAIGKLQALKKGEGANARMAGEMLERLEPLTGAVALKTGTLDENARAQIQEAYRVANEQEESVKGTVTPSPKTAPKGGRIETLGKSKEDVGFTTE